MDLTYHYHRDSDLVSEKTEFAQDYIEIVNTLENISDEDLVSAFNARKKERANIKTKEALIKNGLVNIKAAAELLIQSINSAGKILWCGNGGLRSSNVFKEHKHAISIDIDKL